MRLRQFTRLAGCALLMVSCSALWAQRSKKPLANDDVIAMVKGGVPESVVVAKIHSSPTNFDLSPKALVALHKAGLSKSEMDAVMEAANKGTPGDDFSPTPSSAAPHLPTVALLHRGAKQKLPIETTQMVQTKTKPTSMNRLASDSALGVALQAGVNTASVEATSHIRSMAGNTAVQQAGGMFGGLLARRKSAMTFVWAISNPSSANTAPVSTPAFTVDFSRVAGANPDEFEPAIVKLTPAQNSYRLVGATEGKQDAASDPAADWQVYSHFLEDRVAVTSKKLARGKYRISPASPLMPGEYGIVLRPLAPTKKFSGGDVARNQGDGMLFDSVWSFQVPQDTTAR